MSEASQPDEPNIIPLEEDGQAAAAPACPMCFARRIEPDAPCPRCGFDERKGIESSTALGKAALGRSGLTCRTCGYDLTGLRRPKCPECGEPVLAPSRRDVDRDESSSVVRDAYLRPLLMLLIAGGAMVALTAFFFGAAEAGWYVLGYAIEVPIGVAVFLACCAIWIGFDAPVHLTALRLAGIFAVVDLTALLVSFIPIIGLLGWLVAIAVYIGLLAEMLELETFDAIIVGLVTFIVKLIGGLAVLYAIGA